MYCFSKVPWYQGNRVTDMIGLVIITSPRQIRRKRTQHVRITTGPHNYVLTRKALQRGNVQAVEAFPYPIPHIPITPPDPAPKNPQPLVVPCLL